jgi:large subunit ribosomal protein L21e
MFKRPFRKHGMIPLNTYLHTYKLGDYVDIVVNSTEHRGMPYKYYHGKTGKVWNVSQRALGVEVNKLVGNRILAKRLSIRLEHVRPSKCRQDFLQRRRASEAAHAEYQAKLKAGEKVTKPIIKRLPEQPKPGRIVKRRKCDPMETVTPLKYVNVF